MICLNLNCVGFQTLNNLMNNTTKTKEPISKQLSDQLINITYMYGSIVYYCVYGTHYTILNFNAAKRTRECKKHNTQIRFSLYDE